MREINGDDPLPRRSAEFNYRRRSVDDVMDILNKAGARIPLGEFSHEHDDFKLRLASEAIFDYFNDTK